MKILITGAAGFIGSKLASLLATRGDEVVGIDCINDYYDIRLKLGRLAQCGIVSAYGADMPYGEVIQSDRFPNYRFLRMDISKADTMSKLFKAERFDKVVNLAAQAGVRYSITHPESYVESNLIGFFNVLECCRHHGVKHLVFASSSSVYGLNEKIPYAEEDKADMPVSLYAASKKSNELMAHAYSKLYGFSTVGLRYFTVYGPWGRPDMAPMLFAKAISKGEPIKVFNNGDMRRDFTYIDDIVEGTIKVLDKDLVTEDCINHVPFKVYNIGCGHPMRLMDFISEIELALGKEARKEFLPMQPGDVYQTYADTSKLEAEIGYRPSVSLHRGISEFIAWYQSDNNPLK